MEAICYSETSVDFQRISLRYIPEDRTLHLKLVLNAIIMDPDVYYRLGCDAVPSERMLPTLRGNTLFPSSGEKMEVGYSW
jgi:hypothetical protein